MNFFEAVTARRSIRVYSNQSVPAEVMNQALDAALIAPNSSNMQTWEFYWVKSPAKKAALIEACLSQPAAKTAQELVVFVADDKLWKRNQKTMLSHLNSIPNIPKRLLDYYGKVMPLTYGYRFLAPVKWLMANATGLFRPMPRRPWSPRDIQEVCIKSTALASENFMLAISAQGFDSCPMEGFDETRVKRLLGLPCSARIVMVVSVGKADPAVPVPPRLRFQRDWFVKEV